MVLKVREMVSKAREMVLGPHLRSPSLSPLSRSIPLPLSHRFCPRRSRIQVGGCGREGYSHGCGG